jgi:hypothetical protein
LTGIAAGRFLIRGRDPSVEALLTPANLALVISGVCTGVALGALAVYIPLRMGARALQRMEF